MRPGRTSLVTAEAVAEAKKTSKGFPLMPKEAAASLSARGASLLQAAACNSASTP